jgi:Right handed beta helix region
MCDIRNTFHLTLVLIMLISIPIIANGTVIHVPGDAPTIQAGIDLAQPGETVQVAPGIYNEVKLEMKSGIHLIGSIDDPGEVVIDAETNGIVFNCISLDSATSIQGFTVTGGYGPRYGGGAYCLDSSLLFSHCLFFENEVYHEGGFGGAVFCTGGEPSFSYCTFYNNTATHGCHIGQVGESIFHIDNTILSGGQVGEALYQEDDNMICYISCTNIYNNEGGNWTPGIAEYAWQDGNIYYPSNYCAPEDGDMRLRPCSRLLNGDCGPIGAFGAGDCGAVTIRVPEDTGLIRDAITMASCNDTIEIACGIYYEHRLRTDNPMVIRSESGEAGCVTINATEDTELIRFPDMPGKVVVEGISFTNTHDGAVIVAYGEEVLLKNCSIYDNDEANAIVTSFTDLQVHNCTIANNASPYAGYLGLFRFVSTQAEFRNTIIAGNSGYFLYGIDVDFDFACTNIHGNEVGNWNAIGCVDDLGQNGNISVDPLFCDPEANEYNLQPESPCAPFNNLECGLIGAWPAGGCGSADAQAPDDGMPSDFALYAGHPNPVNPTRTGATISFALPSISNVKLSVLDVSGRVVATLVDDLYLPGNHTVAWNGSTTNGSLVDSGVYFCHLKAGDYTATRKLLITR